MPEHRRHATTWRTTVQPPRDAKPRDAKPRDGTDETRPTVRCTREMQDLSAEALAQLTAKAQRWITERTCRVTPYLPINPVEDL